MPALKTINKKSAWTLAAVLPLAALICGAFFFDQNRRAIEVTGTLQAKEIPVASKVGGRISRVYVSEGQEVKPGDILVEFDAPELEAKRDQLEAGVLRAQAKLDELRKGPRLAEIEKARALAQQSFQNWQLLKNGSRPEDIEKARANRVEAESNLDMLTRGYRAEEINSAKFQAEQARIQLDLAKKDYENYQTLQEKGAVSPWEETQQKSKFEAAEQAFNASNENFRKLKAGPRAEEISAARQKLNVARANEEMMRKGSRVEEIEAAHQQYLSCQDTLLLLEQGTRVEEIDQAAADLKNARGALAELDAQLAERKITSPVAAEVSVMDLHSGEVIAPQKSIATLTRLDEVWTRAYVPEKELGRVRVGQNVEVRVDAFPNKSFKGKIVQIPSVAEFTPRNVQTADERSAQVFGLKITIANKEHLLRGGMNATISLPPADQPYQSVARRDDAEGDSPR